MNYAEENQYDEQGEYERHAQAVLADQPEPQALQALGTKLLGEFTQAEQDRIPTEERWLRDLRQYRGIYDPEVERAIGTRRSKAFVRKTRVKIKTIDSRVADLLFPSGAEKNWEVSPTPKPTISPEQKQQIAMRLQQQAQGQPVPPDVLQKALIETAKKAAQGMSKTIDDQLTEARYKQACLKAIHSGHLYGTGIIKGPLVERRVRTRFQMVGRQWKPVSEAYLCPFVECVPVWRWYPDMSGGTELDYIRFAWERHDMTQSQMAELAQRPSFSRGREKIIEYIKGNPNGTTRVRHFETGLREMGDRANRGTDTGGTYEVLERWGWLDGECLAQVGIEVPKERCHESFFSNVWMLPNGEIIKAVLQPINGVTWPYHLYHFDKDETSIFGEGLASVMRHDQEMLNAATRLMIDNGAITAGPQLEIFTNLLNPLDRHDELVPWKVWRRNSEAHPNVPAVRAIELPNRLGDLSSMAQMFEANADEVTAIPRYMSGENVSQGAAGTAAGMSMLMGAANIVIKDLVNAWDEGVTRSFIESLYRWNMQFNPDDTIKGDFDVKARGTASLVAREVRARQLNEFAATTANELDAPFIKRDVLNRLRAEAHEMSDLVKTEEEVVSEQSSEAAMMQQQLAMQQQQLMMQQQQAMVAKAMADAELAKAKVEETLAKVDEIVAATISKRVEAAYAALQAGGVATQTPFVAPAGDEILRSSGWKDFTMPPTIAQLNTPAVQGEMPQNPEPGLPEAPQAADVEPQTGMVGRRAGIETPTID